MNLAHAFRICVAAMSVAWAGCYLWHAAPEEDELPAMREPMRLPEGPKHERPSLPPIECTVQPTRTCDASFPRIMIVMDASSSMLVGRSEGANNWDKARFALAGNPRALGPNDPGFVRPAFARELEVRGNLVTMEDVFHLGMIVFNAEDVQRLLLQYTPCATDNIAWAMDPYVSCELPGCLDPYEGQPVWTPKNSDLDRDPPFRQTTFSYMPPCNPDGPAECAGRVYNTYTAEGLGLAAANIEQYRERSSALERTAATRFANILITDGETSPGSTPEPVLARMSAAGVPTYVIGLAPGDADVERALEQLNRYAEEGGTGFATLVPASGPDIADAFAEAVTRIIDDLGTDPCCQPQICRADPEPNGAL
jgi:von Willebrand factor type A domain